MFFKTKKQREYEAAKLEHLRKMADRRGKLNQMGDSLLRQQIKMYQLESGVGTEAELHNWKRLDELYKMEN